MICNKKQCDGMGNWLDDLVNKGQAAGIKVINTQADKLINRATGNNTSPPSSVAPSSVAPSYVAPSWQMPMMIGGAVIGVGFLITMALVLTRKKPSGA